MSDNRKPRDRLEYNRRRTAEKIAAGICLRCNRQAIPNRQMCQVCTDKSNAAQRAKYAEMKRRREGTSEQMRPIGIAHMWAGLNKANNRK